MVKTFAEVTEVQIVELSAMETERVSGAGDFEWGVQDPNENYDWT